MRTQSRSNILLNFLRIIKSRTLFNVNIRERCRRRPHMLFVGTAEYASLYIIYMYIYLYPTMLYNNLT